LACSGQLLLGVLLWSHTKQALSFLVSPGRVAPIGLGFGGLPGVAGVACTTRRGPRPASGYRRQMVGE
jgi:hypothetical protein